MKDALLAAGFVLMAVLWILLALAAASLPVVLIWWLVTH